VTAHIHVVFPKLTRTSVDPQVWHREVGVKRMDEESAYALAQRVTRTADYRVREVRHAWSAAVAWQVEAEDRRTDERLLLLSEDQFDSRLTEAGQPDAGEITTAQTTAHVTARPEKRAVAHHS
jgi:hypothetical protein